RRKGAGPPRARPCPCRRAGSPARRSDAARAGAPPSRARRMPRRGSSAASSQVRLELVPVLLEPLLLRNEVVVADAVPELRPPGPTLVAPPAAMGLDPDRDALRDDAHQRRATRLVEAVGVDERAHPLAAPLDRHAPLARLLVGA